MKSLFLFLILSMLWNPMKAQESSQNSLPFIVLKEKAGALFFDKIEVGNNQTIEILDPEVITFILPLSEGKAAGLTRAADRESAIVVQNRDNSFAVTVRSPDGKEKSFPQVPFESLRSFVIRVNIISGGGTKQAYRIDGYNTITKDDGPVIDLFQGMIPMEAGDWSVTLETEVQAAETAITGSFPFLLVDGWMVAEGTLPDGKTGKFILDTGASGSMVIKEGALPENTSIMEMKSVAYSFAGTAEADASMQGATGDVSGENFPGMAELSSFELGDMTLRNVQANVMRKLPAFLEKHDIIGIIGMDVLRHAEVFRVEFDSPDGGTISFLLHEKEPSSGFDHSIPLSTASNLLFASGTIQGTPVDLILDTGARNSILSQAMAEENGWTYRVKGTSSITGIDGVRSKADEINIPTIAMGTAQFEDCHFLLSPGLEITKSMGLERSGAILGMSFFKAFSVVEIDFVEAGLRLRE